MKLPNTANKKGKIFVIVMIFVLLFILFTYLFNEVKILKKKIENLEKNDTALSERIQENTGKISNIQSQRENVSDESRQLAESVFDCSPTDGLSPISEEEAKRVWEEFKKEYNIDVIPPYRAASPSRRNSARRHWRPWRAS